MPSLLSRLDLHPEAVRPLQDDVRLQLVLGLRHRRAHPIRAQDRRQQNLQLDHRVLAAHAAARSRAERNEAVVVALLRALRQKVVRIEDVRIRVDVRAPVDLQRANHHRAAGRQHVVLGRQLHVLVQFARNDRHRRIHAQRLQDHALQVLHVHAVGERALALRLPEDAAQLRVHLVLDIGMGAQQAQHEAGAGRGGVVALEHDGVHLLLDVGVGQIGAALGRLDHQVEEGEAALLADVVLVVVVQVVAQALGFGGRGRGFRRCGGLQQMQRLMNVLFNGVF